MIFSISQVLLIAIGFAGVLAWLTRFYTARSARAAGAASRDSEVAVLNAHISDLNGEVAERDATIASTRHKLAQADMQLGEARAGLVRFEERCNDLPKLQQQVEIATAQKEDLAQRYAEACANLKSIETELRGERKRNEERIADFTEAKETMTNQFKALAADVLSHNSKRLTESSQKALAGLIDPLKQRITAFDEQVVKARAEDSANRQRMLEELKQLQVSQSKISEDANNLTRALKSDSQAQGAWGEMIAERILEKSGLRRDEEFEVQAHGQNEDGQRIRPDILVRLPEDRAIVVDSKVSLTAFEQAINAETDEARQDAIARHVTSMRNHITGLSAKNYHELVGTATLDFTLMFVPNESALNLALSESSELFELAVNGNIVLASPNTLMAALKTIAYVWQSERQNQNALRIAQEAGKMHDKFVGFIADLEKVGTRLDQATIAYDHAHRKLTTGRGNLVTKTDKLRQLGATASKRLTVVGSDPAIALQK